MLIAVLQEVCFVVVVFCSLAYVCKILCHGVINVYQWFIALPIDLRIYRQLKHIEIAESGIYRYFLYFLQRQEFESSFKVNFIVIRVVTKHIFFCVAFSCYFASFACFIITALSLSLKVVDNCAHSTSFQKCCTCSFFFS